MKAKQPQTNHKKLERFSEYMIQWKSLLSLLGNQSAFDLSNHFNGHICVVSVGDSFAIKSIVIGAVVLYSLEASGRCTGTTKLMS